MALNSPEIERIPNAQDLLGPPIARSGKLIFHDLPCSYRLERIEGSKVKAEVILTSKNNDRIEYKLLVDRNGDPIEGSLNGKPFNREQITNFLVILQEIIDADWAQKREGEVRNSPRILSNLNTLLALNGIKADTPEKALRLDKFSKPTYLHPDEIKAQKWVKNTSQELPPESPPLPNPDLFLQTDTCSIIGTKYLGSYVFYFSKRSGEYKGRKGELNDYGDAILFPDNGRNRSDIIMAWSLAYSEIRRGVSEDKVFNILRDSAIRIESDSKR